MNNINPYAEYELTLAYSSNVLGKNHPLIELSNDSLLNSKIINQLLKKTNRKFIISYFAIIGIAAFSGFSFFSIVLAMFSGFGLSKLSELLKSNTKVRNTLLGFNDLTEHLENKILNILKQDSSIIKNILIEQPYLDRSDLSKLATHVVKNDPKDIIRTIDDLLFVIKRKHSHKVETEQLNELLNVSKESDTSDSKQIKEKFANII